jgi:hypothetical protein
MTPRFGDETIVVDFPELVAANSNVICSSASSGIRSDQYPMKRSHVSSQFEFVECDDHVRKTAHPRAICAIAALPIAGS